MNHKKHQPGYGPGYGMVRRRPIKTRHFLLLLQMLNEDCGLSVRLNPQRAKCPLCRGDVKDFVDFFPVNVGR